MKHMPFKDSASKIPHWSATCKHSQTIVCLTVSSNQFSSLSSKSSIPRRTL